MDEREFYEEYEMEPDEQLLSFSQKLSYLEDELRLLEKCIHQRATDKKPFIGLPIEDKKPLLDICSSLLDHATALNGLVEELAVQAKVNSSDVLAWKYREVNKLLF